MRPQVQTSPPRAPAAVEQQRVVSSGSAEALPLVRSSVRASRNRARPGCKSGPARQSCHCLAKQKPAPWDAGPAACALAPCPSPVTGLWQESMATLLRVVSPQAAPFGADRKRFNTEANRFRAATVSRSVYVGNLSFATTEPQVHALMSRAGPVDRVVMGLNRDTRLPCGFAFVEFVDRAGAVAAVSLLTGAVLDGRVIRLEMDKGFREWRRWGRGAGGGQMRDEFRASFDEGRGGYGAAAAAAGAAAAAMGGGGGGGRSGSRGFGRAQSRGRQQQRGGYGGGRSHSAGGRGRHSGGGGAPGGGYSRSPGGGGAAGGWDGQPARRGPPPPLFGGEDAGRGPAPTGPYTPYTGPGRGRRD